MRELIETYDLNLDPGDPMLIDPSFFDRTLVGQRRGLADLLRLQLYGVLWAATGIDQDIPETYTLRQEDLEADRGFHNLQPPHLQDSDLALEILSAGVRLAGDTPVLLVNEPMFISQGQNSDIRYNFYYPRWAYDAYRRIMSEESQRNNWQYLDLWNAVPGSEFTNSAVHMTPDGTRLYPSQVLRAILDLENSSPK